MAKTFNRDTKGDDYASGQTQEDPAISREVEDLLKGENVNDFQAWQKLKQKYGNKIDYINEVMDAYKSVLQKIQKKAKKFKQKIFDRYAGLNLPFHELMKKAKKYQKKWNLTDAEFNMFIILALTDKSSQYAMTMPNTKLSKVLGFDTFVASTSQLNINPNEASVVEEIINKYGETKPLHAQIVMQSLTYRDASPEALTGSFNRDKHNPYSYIHPVVAALFIPKVPILDEQMLIANIGYIIKCKSMGWPISTKPDFDLYWSMITDPNNSACDPVSAIQDIKNRFNLQCELWDAVLNLRQGRYYVEMDRFLKFMRALENCRNIIHDAPDLTYVKDEGTILRRLLSAFSIHPTIISVNRLFGMMSGAQFGFPSPLSSPFDTNGLNNITTIPMITLRLPLYMGLGQQKAVSLEEALSQPQWFVENKTIVPKIIQIIHSRDVLFFYVGRRYQNINITRLNTPYCFQNLPMTVSGWEAMNDHPVNAPAVMTIMNDTFELKSVVAVEKTQVNQKSLIIGSTAMFAIRRNVEAGNFQESYFVYDPQGAGQQIWDDAKNQYGRNQPITTIAGETPFNGQDDKSFNAIARCRGTIFMYQKVSSLVPCLELM